MDPLTPAQAGLVKPAPASGKLPLYRELWVQVMVAIALAIVLGYVSPARAIAMKPLGDAFIRVITMIITLIIFCTVVTGIAGMENLKKVGRVGGMALALLRSRFHHRPPDRTPGGQRRAPGQRL